VNKFILAFKCFFQIFMNTKFSEHVSKFFEKPVPQIEEDRLEDTRILAILQRDARFMDFLQEKIDSCTDSQIGAVARTIHEKCNKALNNYITIEEVLKEEEGKPVTIEKGFNPSEIRLTGNVTGSPPFKGTLRHHGWKVLKTKLPPLPEGDDGSIIEPAEVEI